jgi:arginyl-tRNA synthetase
MSYPLNECRKEILTKLKKELISHRIDINIEIPDESKGDFAFPCFPLASLKKKSPQDIATDLAKSISKGHWIADIESKGGYVNFFINQEALLSSTLQLILEMKDRYGQSPKKKKKVIIEHTSANPNGPLHVGRARNPIIGDTLVRIFKAAGYHVEAQFYLDDMGKQVAILTWGVNHLKKKDISPSLSPKADHQMVGFYQKANELMEKDEHVAQEIGDIIHHSEQGDPEVLQKIHSAYAPVLKGMTESLNRINIHVDQYIPESKFVRDKSVQNVIQQLKHTPFYQEEHGAHYLDLKSFGIQGRTTKFFFIRKNGTTLYATRDIAYHQWKAQQADILINVLGEDHKLESKQVKIALQLLKTKIIPQVVFYSFVSLPGGKMSTRKGRVVYLDDLIDECIERAYLEVKKRRGTELTNQQMTKISEMVGIGALRYNLIKVQPEKDIVFRWEEALNFEGNAVPFIQYAHARACSILRKRKDKTLTYNAKVITHPSEVLLVKQLARLPLVIEEACTGCKPHLIATYLYETASKFNQFYRDCPVLQEKNTIVRTSRLTIVKATQIVLANTLKLLGITAPEEM